jgi:enoyl-CoA hydratase/carnithine racemase
VTDDAPDAADTPDVLYERDGAVVVITINRPERGNSLSKAVRSRLYESWERFESDDTARVAILTGAGERIFCAGADLQEMVAESTGQPPPDWAPVIGESVTVSKPTIAAVNGAALGGGLLQAVMCDIVVASESATFGISEARWGRGTPWVLPLFRLYPPKMLIELMLTATPMSAQRAREAGLANLVTPPTALMPVATELARTIAGNAPLSVAAAKEMVRLAVSGLPRDAVRARNDEIWHTVYSSEDAQIGPRAFTEGTTPQWTGR